MKITQIQIKNFKCFRDVTLMLDPDLNVFTGVNNSGKTTVLEALALWVECFTKLLWKTSKHDRKRGINPGQYRLDHSQPYYEPPANVISVRSPNFYSIFYNRESKQPIGIGCVIENNGSRFELEFGIKATRGSNYQILFLSDDRLDHVSFNQAFEHFPDPIGLMYAAPVAAILPVEQFQTEPKLSYLINTRQSTQVLRNRLYRLYSRSVQRWSEMLEDVSEILDAKVEITFDSDAQSDIEVLCNATVGARDVPKDISLLGSGSLQIIEILLNLYSNKRDLNLVLLDEPDSHIHRDIQRRLMSVISREPNHQVFISTHSESLIRSVAPKHVFHLEANATTQAAPHTYHPIVNTSSAGARIGLQPSPYIKVLTALGNENALDYLNALEADRLILVEGEDDARYIEAIRDRHGPRQRQLSAMYWSFNGLDTLLDQIGAYKDIFKQFRNQDSLWEKAVMVFDRDRLTTDQRTEVMSKLTDKLAIPVYIWCSYTIEATLLSDLECFTQLLLSALDLEADPKQQATVIELVEREHQRLCENFREQLHTDKFESELKDVTENRRKKIAKLLKLKTAPGIPTGDLKRVQVYRADAKAGLDQDRCDHLARKEDVEAIVRAVYQHVGQPFDARTWFEELIKASSSRTRFAQWGELLDVLQASPSRATSASAPRPRRARRARKG
ncbi:MAG: AAA family ATPase [Haliangiales bacterium]